MPGYLAPATPPPWVAPSLDLTAAIALGSKAAPTKIVAGQGISVRTDPTLGLLLDAAAAEPSQVLSHFQPGALVTGKTLRTFASSRTRRTAIGSLVEVQLGTAAVKGAGGNIGLNIAGDFGGSTDLQLNVDGQLYYTLNLQAPTTLGAHSSSSSQSAMLLASQIAYPFQVTTPSTVFGVIFTAAANLPGANRRVGLLDANGHWIASGKWLGGVAPGTGPLTVLLDLAVPLATGKVYYFAVQNLDGGSAGCDRGVGVSGIVTSGPAAPASGVPWAHTGQVMDFSTLVTIPSQGGDTWWFDTPEHGGSSLFGNGDPNGDGPQFTLLGRNSGLELDGNIIVTTTNIGAAPGTPPADMNLRIEVS